MAKKLHISGKELAWYIVGLSICVCGLFFIVCGIVSDYLPGLASKNWIKIAETQMSYFFTFTITWRGFGLVIFAVGAFMFVVTLLANAKKSDRAVEKKLRRSQRMVSMQGATAPSVIEAKEEPTPNTEVK